MKKLYIGMTALVMTVSAVMTQAFAATLPSITVDNGSNNSVSYTYSNSDTKETKEDASRLFGRFANVTSNGSVIDNLTVTSVNKNGGEVEVYIKFEADDVENHDALLDYYDFVVTDQNGEVIYDDSVADQIIGEKIIPLGIFNTQFTKDVKKYSIEYTIDSELNGKLDKEELSKLKVYIASVPVEKQVAGTITATTEPVSATATVAPTTAAPAAATQVAPAAAAATSAPANTVAPSATVAPTATPATIVKVCGKDISAGRYVVTGNGVVLIKSKNGDTKSETTVTDGTVDGVKGVKQFVVNLTDGDEINVSPLAGQKKPSIKFEKTNGTTASTSNSGSKTGTSTKTAAASKTNPKTGEGGVPVSIMCMIMAVSAAAVCGLEIFKRKKLYK